MRLGPVIRSHRQRLGMSVTQLAGKTGVTPAYIRMLENGTRQPSLDMLERLSRSLRTSTSTLLRQAEGGDR